MRNLIVLPTLDGSKEAAIARLEALDRRYELGRITDELSVAYSEAEEIVQLVGERHGAGKQAAKVHLSAVEASIVNVEVAIERLVAS